MNDGQQPVTPIEESTETQPQVFQPGQTISPGSAPAAPTISEAAPQPQAVVPPQPEPSVEPAAVFDPAPVVPNDQPLITWTASEFIAHDKSTAWYGKLALVGIIVAAVVFLLSRDVISTVVVLVCTALFGVYAARKPRQVQYQLDESGLTIGHHQYFYPQFRSFALVDEGPFASLVFMPLKRFAPLLSVYFDPADEDAITGVVAEHLPFEERHLDMLERMLKRVRF